MIFPASMTQSSVSLRRSMVFPDSLSAFSWFSGHPDCCFSRLGDVTNHALPHDTAYELLTELMKHAFSALPVPSLTSPLTSTRTPRCTELLRNVTPSQHNGIGNMSNLYSAHVLFAKRHAGITLLRRRTALVTTTHPLLTLTLMNTGIRIFVGAWSMYTLQSHTIWMFLFWACDLDGCMPNFFHDWCVCVCSVPWWACDLDGCMPDSFSNERCCTNEQR
jgi:hypothetical protein